MRSSSRPRQGSLTINSITFGDVTPIFAIVLCGALMATLVLIIENLIFYNFYSRRRNLEGYLGGVF